MKIKIIKDSPAPGQDSIEHLIGQTFEVSYEVEKFGVKTGQVCIHADDGMGEVGPLIIQPLEYEVIPEKNVWQKIAEYTGF